MSLELKGLNCKRKKIRPIYLVNMEGVYKKMGFIFMISWGFISSNCNFKFLKIPLVAITCKLNLKLQFMGFNYF